MKTKNHNVGKDARWPRPLAGLRGITLGNLPREITAGITLAALVIPLNIGYAQVAGLPAIVGLYAGIFPLAIYALFTASRHVVGSPDASIAALMGATLLGFAAPGDPIIVQYALALALMCGLLFFVFWYFRLAFLADFLSRAVLVGFITGLGIEVLTSQLRKIVGVHAETGETIAADIKETIGAYIETEGYFLELIELIKSIPHANLYAVAIGVGAIVIVRLIKRYAPKLPGALVALIVLTTVVGVFDLDEHGVSVLGELDPEPPSIRLPAVPPVDYLKLLGGAMALVAITLSEGLLLVRRYSRKYGYKADGNQVLFAYGLSSITAGLTGSLMMGNSPSRSAAMDSSGAKSQLPSLVAAGTVTLVLLFFTDALALLPNAALAGIVANAVLSLIEVKEMRVLFRMRRSDFWIALVCMLSVLVLGPLRAVIIAFLLSTIDVVRRAARPRTSVLQEVPDGSHLVSGETGCAETAPGLIVYRFEAPLYFANANLFLEEVEQLVTQAPTAVKWFVVDAQAIVDIDTTGAEVLEQSLNQMEQRGVTFALSRASETFLSHLKRYGLLEHIGKDDLYTTNRQAAEAFRQETREAVPPIAPEKEERPDK